MNFSIHTVQFGDELYFRAAELARDCSFQGSGRYLCELMLQNSFCDFERVFAACKDHSVIGFCVIAKESCVEDSSSAPWLDFLFVTEEFRNYGIASALVKHTVNYARSLSFTELFLCTASHEAFYKKLGFETIFETDINECTIGKVMKLNMASK